MFLPTFLDDSWEIVAFRDSIRDDLRAGAAGIELRLYFYAVSLAGWREISRYVRGWKSAVRDRTVTAYIGTDHGLTTPEALLRMENDGVNVRLMMAYRGVYHPKVVWLTGASPNVVWVGSNNLTGDGLLRNVEFALRITSRSAPPSLRKWGERIHGASAKCTSKLRESYAKERARFADARIRAGIGTFTWTKRTEPKRPEPRDAYAGDLIIEVMPKETGAGGSQIQLPMAAAVQFFGLPNTVGAHLNVILRPVGSSATRQLQMTIFGNRTARLVISELDYRDRPCVIRFHKRPNGGFEFEIVPESIYPTRYRGFLAKSTKQTRSGSRRWGILR